MVEEQRHIVAAAVNINNVQVRNIDQSYIREEDYNPEQFEEFRYRCENQVEQDLDESLPLHLLEVNSAKHA